LGKEKTVKRFYNFFAKFEAVIMVIGMGIMVTLNFANVVARKALPSIPMSFTEEVIVLIFLWISMFGISYCYRTHSHTALNLISEYLPKAGKIIFLIIGAAVSIAFVSFLTYTGWNMVQNYLKYDQILPSTGIPMAVQGFALPIGGVVIIITVIMTLIFDIQKLIKGEEEEK
jgi:TRAP-type C4-dicarboxylate transport system permease small subunit